MITLMSCDPCVWRRVWQISKPDLSGNKISSSTTSIEPSVRAASALVPSAARRVRYPCRDSTISNAWAKLSSSSTINTVLSVISLIREDFWWKWAASDLENLVVGLYWAPLCPRRIRQGRIRHIGAHPARAIQKLRHHGRAPPPGENIKVRQLDVGVFGPCFDARMIQHHQRGHLWFDIGPRLPEHLLLNRFYNDHTGGQFRLRSVGPTVFGPDRIGDHGQTSGHRHDPFGQAPARQLVDQQDQPGRAQCGGEGGDKFQKHRRPFLLSGAAKRRLHGFDHHKGIA